MSRILVISHLNRITSSRTFGPNLRIIEISKALAEKGHDVTLAEINREKEETLENIRCINYDSGAILKTINTSYDVVLLQVWFDDRDFLEKVSIPIVVDVYAPFLLEHINYPYDLNNPDSVWRFTDDILLPSLIPLRYGDYFVCASHIQRNYYIGMLSSLGRVNPENKDRKMIGLLPYGISKNKQIPGEKILHEKIPEGKKIILWLSTFFPWLDPLRSAEIIYELSRLKPDYVLAVVGAKSPFVNPSLYQENFNKFYFYCTEKSLLDKTVFMFDWQDFESLDSIYAEADMFLATYPPDTLETEYSYRTRIIDALRGRLPVICDAGDIVSELVMKNKLGYCIGAMNAKESAKIIAGIKEKDLLKIRESIEKFIPSQSWDILISDLDSFCRNPSIDNSKSHYPMKNPAEERRELVLQLRSEIKARDEFLEKLTREYKKEIELQAEIANEKDNEINNLRQLKTINSQQAETITKLKIALGRFRSSIVYPLYRFTSTMGQTGFGRFLQRILK